MIPLKRYRPEVSEAFHEAADGAWVKAEAAEVLVARNEALEREVRYLRSYGNKDCTAMADEAMKKGELDEPQDVEDLDMQVRTLASVISTMRDHPELFKVGHIFRLENLLDSTKNLAKALRVVALPQPPCSHTSVTLAADTRSGVCKTCGEHLTVHCGHMIVARNYALVGRCNACQSDVYRCDNGVLHEYRCKNVTCINRDNIPIRDPKDYPRQIPAWFTPFAG